MIVSLAQSLNFASSQGGKFDYLILTRVRMAFIFHLGPDFNILQTKELDSVRDRALKIWSEYG